MDDKDWYMLDVGIAFEHLMLEAVKHGFGTCWVGWFDSRKVEEAIGVESLFSPGLRVVALTPLGYPDEEPPQSPRKPLDEIVRYCR